MDSIVDISARAVNLPLKEAFETAQRRAEHSETVFVELKLAGGIVGMGEATPVKYVTNEDQSSVVAAVEQIRDMIIGRSIGEYRLIARDAADAIPSAKSARNGVETALLDACGKLCGIPVYSLLGGRSMRIETDVTIPIVPPEHARELASEAAERGFRLFKVKVGGDFDTDVERCRTIVSASPGSSLVTDANQGYEPEEAVRFAETLTEMGIPIELLEQPVKKEDIQGLKWVTEHAHVPVFADEAAQTPAQVLEIAKHGAATGVNVKLMKAGMLGALEIVSICRAAGLELMLGCMLESRIGAAASLHVACGTGAFSHFDLDSDQLLADQPVRGGFVRDRAYLVPWDLPGLGVEGLSS